MKKNDAHETRTRAGGTTADEALAAVYITSSPGPSPTLSITDRHNSHHRQDRQPVSPSRVGTRPVGWRLPQHTGRRRALLAELATDRRLAERVRSRLSSN